MFNEGEIVRETNNGGPAFPVPSNTFNDMEGMTLRDYFAAKAMQGMLSDSALDAPPGTIATAAYRMADSMLQARKQ
jgi:hypothetical protein